MNVDDDAPVPTSAQEAFACLGHETRLAILHALWEARDPTNPVPQRAVPFTELRERVGVRDPGQFGYHLKRLLGVFVHRTDEGYVLREAGQRVVSAIRAGALTDEVVFDAEPIDAPCPLCGGQVVLDYGTEPLLDWLVARCAACEGAWTTEEQAGGVLFFWSFLLPEGGHDRTPDELYRAQLTQMKHQMVSMIEGVCPECSGTVTATPLVCEAHDASEGHPCEQCGTLFEIRFRHVCEVCKLVMRLTSGRHIVVHPTVRAFYHDHGYETWGHEWVRIETETIADQTVVSDDPFAIEVTVVVEDDRLAVTLDADGTVTDVRA